MHEDPEMPNYGKRGRGKLFIEGMVVAIEPMINMGTKHQTTERWLDNLTADENQALILNMMLLIDGKPEILSTLRMYIKH
jgi:methionyl aminopeptidase